MTRSKRSHLFAALAVLAVLLTGSGCGGSEDSTTSPKAAPSAPEQMTESGAAAVPPKQEDQAKKAKPRNSGKPNTARGAKKDKAKSSEGKRAATDTGHPEQPDDLPKRVRELVDGDSGTQVVDSARELDKVLREIKRSKQGQETPPVVEKILEEARGGRP